MEYSRNSDSGRPKKNEPVNNALHDAFVSLDINGSSYTFQYNLDKLPEKFHTGMLYDSLRRALSKELKTFVMAAWSAIEPIDIYCLRVPSQKTVIFDPLYLLRNPVWTVRKTGFISLIEIDSNMGYFRKKTKDMPAVRPTWNSTKNESSETSFSQPENS